MYQISYTEFQISYTEFLRNFEMYNEKSIIEKDTVTNIEIGETLGNRDHSVICLDIILEHQKKDNKTIVPNFRAAHK